MEGWVSRVRTEAFYSKFDSCFHCLCVLDHSYLPTFSISRASAMRAVGPLVSFLRIHGQTNALFAKNSYTIGLALEAMSTNTRVANT